MSATENIDIARITVADRLRSIDMDSVERIAESIDEIGLRTPITVRASGKDLILVAGAHRLEAVKRLGKTKIEAFVVENWNEREARRWEIAENLHRAGLSKLEEDEQLAEWIKITEELVSSRVGTKLSERGRVNEGRPESGVNAAARQLGKAKTTSHRAIKIAGLSAAAKKVAVEQQLQNNRRAMAVAARETTAEEQIAVLKGWKIKVEPDTVGTMSDAAARRASRIDGDVKGRAAQEVAEIIVEYVPADAWDGLKANLYAAGAAAVANALTNITGQSIMDRRHGEAA